MAHVRLCRVIGEALQSFPIKKENGRTEVGILVGLMMVKVVRKGMSYAPCVMLPVFNSAIWYLRSGFQ